jgi:RimJ/RimL family protein N-acetyltransferase
MRPTVRLRPATAADADLLLAWRNDPATRAASFGSEEIPRDAHLRWLARKLEDENCALLVIEIAGAPVGQLRLERDGDTAEVHIALAPAARGRSIGRHALRTAVAEARSLLGVSRITANVKPENEASLRAFEAAGFRVVTRDAGVVVLVATP